jgi:hypothetical protein
MVSLKTVFFQTCIELPLNFPTIILSPIETETNERQKDGSGERDCCFSNNSKIFRILSGYFE